MAFVSIPLSRGVLDAAGRGWGLRFGGGDAVRLHGGEESAAYRLGDLVVRIGPPTRSSEEAEWCHAVARQAAASGVSEAVAPLPARDGTTVIRVAGRPVSVWPFVEGEWPNRDDPSQAAQAARLLGRLHRALLTAAPRFPPRPVPSLLERGPYAPDLSDPALDRWLTAFHRRHPLVHPLHGDYYRGNLLARGGHIVAVLDWDDALVGPPALEAATAAREFTHPWTTDFRQARRFLAAYDAAGGTAGDLDDESLAQLIRHRLRCEASWFEEHRAGERAVDEDDLEYQRRTRELFLRLRP